MKLFEDLWVKKYFSVRSGEVYISGLKTVKTVGANWSFVDDIAFVIVLSNPPAKSLTKS